jgi:hypothetical protein
MTDSKNFLEYSNYTSTIYALSTLMVLDSISISDYNDYMVVSENTKDLALL